MGYTKFIVFGNKIEVYEYAKEVHPDRKDRTKSEIQKKRDREIKEYNKKIGHVPDRAKSSINRARSAFFRLVHHNNCNARTIHFLTLTFAQNEINYKTATRATAHFFQRLKHAIAISHKEVSLSFISVPELTKAGRYHFHILLYNLPPEISVRERDTRDLQRLFQRGYLDISLATYASEGLAGYMAKYMAKNISDPKNEAVRGYTCSRNIDRFTEKGANDISVYTDMLVNNCELDRIDEYETIHLGRCVYKKYSSIKNYARERGSNGRAEMSST